MLRTQSVAVKGNIFPPDVNIFSSKKAYLMFEFKAIPLYKEAMSIRVPTDYPAYALLQLRAHLEMLVGLTKPLIPYFWQDQSAALMQPFGTQKNT